MFVILSLDVGSLSLKCTHENYADLVERSGISPCSHNMWKHQWVTLESLNVVFDSELRDLIAASYRLIYDKLPKGVRAGLDLAGKPRKTARKAAGRAGR